MLLKAKTRFMIPQGQLRKLTPTARLLRHSARRSFSRNPAALRPGSVGDAKSFDHVDKTFSRQRRADSSRKDRQEPRVDDQSANMGLLKRPRPDGAQIGEGITARNPNPTLLALLSSTDTDRMSRRADHFQRISSVPLPLQKVTSMAVAAASREEMEKAWEAYTAVIDRHNEGLTSLHDSREDFTLLARAFSSTFPNDKPEDVNQCVVMVRRVIADIRTIFRRYSRHLVSSTIPRASELTTLILAIRRTVRPIPDDKNPHLDDVASFLLELEECDGLPSLQTANTIIGVLVCSLGKDVSERLASEGLALVAHIVDVKMPEWCHRPNDTTLDLILDFARRTMSQSISYLASSDAKSNNGRYGDFFDDKSLPLPTSTVPTASSKNPRPSEVESVNELFRSHRIQVNHTPYAQIIAGVVRSGSPWQVRQLLDEVEQTFVHNGLGHLPLDFYTHIARTVANEVQFVSQSDAGASGDSQGKSSDRNRDKTKDKTIAQLGSLSTNVIDRCLRVYKYPSEALLGAWLSSLFPAGVEYKPPIVPLPGEASDSEEMSSNSQLHTRHRFIRRAAVFGNPGRDFEDRPLPRTSMRLRFTRLSSALKDSARILRQLRLLLDGDMEPQHILQFSLVEKHLAAVAIAGGLGGQRLLEPHREIDIVRELEEWKTFFDRFGFSASLCDKGASMDFQFSILRIYTLVAIGEVDQAEQLLTESCRLGCCGEPNWLSLAYVLAGFSWQRRRDDVVRVFENMYWGARKQQDNLSAKDQMVGFPFYIYLEALLGMGPFWARKVLHPYKNVMNSRSKSEPDRFILMDVYNSDGLVSKSIWSTVAANVTSETVTKAVRLLDDQLHPGERDLDKFAGNIRFIDVLIVVDALWSEGSLESQLKARKIVESMPVAVLDPNLVKMLYLDTSGTLAQRFIKHSDLLTVALARIGLVSRAVSVIEPVLALGLRFKTAHPFIVTFRAAQYGSTEDQTRALGLFDALQESGYPLTAACYTTVMRLYVRAGDIEKALSILKIMEKNGMTLVVQNFNLILSALADSADKGRMKIILSYMLKHTDFEDNLRMSPHIWSSVVKLSSRFGLWKSVLLIWENVKNMSRKGYVVHVDGVLAAAVLDSLGRNLRPKECTAFWEELRLSFPELLQNENVWNSRIEALLRFRDVNEALHTIEHDMPLAGVQPSSKTLYTFLFPLLVPPLQSDVTADIVRRTWAWCETSDRQDTLRMLVRDIKPEGRKRLRQTLPADAIATYFDITLEL